MGPKENTRKQLGRGGYTNVLQDVIRENYALIFGCEPTGAVGINSSMIKDLIYAFMSRMDRKTLSITFPDVID